MKLYEYTALVKKSVVIAAETREEASLVACGFSDDDWNRMAQTVGVSDVDLLEIRDPKSTRLGDEADVRAAKTNAGSQSWVAV